MATNQTPNPSSLPLVDEDGRTINLCALVVGDDADDYLTQVAKASSQASVEELTRAGDGDEGHWLYLPVRLGDIRGWSTNVHLYAFTNDAHAVLRMQRYGARADGVVIAEPLDAVPGEATRGLAVALARSGHNPPAVVCGDPALAAKWSSLCDYQPAGAVGRDEALKGLKLLTARMLGRVRT